MKHLATVVFFWLCTVSSVGWAIPQPQDDDQALQEVIVTGSFIRQGGAQDVNFLRGEVQSSRIPHPETFTAEGLLGSHNILFDSDRACAKLFCLIGEASTAELLVQPEARYLVGLGFASKLSAQQWRRPPLNLVAVVDKSGSMDGTPLELVKKSLLQIVQQLQPDDQLSIVLYGSTTHVHLAPTSAGSDNRAQLQQSIAAIVSEGSTFLEAGLALGYDVARSTREAFPGTTHVMLFTDERPNVGNTAAAGFMSMARSAARIGIGLTTIGVGVQFDAALATQISSVRGGNLFFLRDASDVTAVFANELDNMVTEVAHDLKLSITPAAGYKVAGVYGVPGELLGYQGDQTVEVNVPSVFLSTKAGAIFVTVAKRLEDADLPARPLLGDEPLLRVALSYTPAETTVPEADAMSVAPPSGPPSQVMQLGHLLIDEFTVLRRATTAHHLENDQQAAYRYMRALASRLRQTKLADLDQERKLVDSLEERFAFLSGNQREPGLARSSAARLWGMWRVRSVQGRTEFRPNEKLEFTADSQLRWFQREAGEHVLTDEFEFSLSRRQILVEDTGEIYNYELRGNELVLEERPGTLVFLQRSR